MRVAGQSVLVRCDANGAVGLGHLSRCLSIALAIRTIDPDARILFCGDYGAFALQLLAHHRFERLEVPAMPCTAAGADTMQAASADCDLLLLDSYAIEQSFIDRLVRRRCRLAVLDDLQQLDLSQVDIVACFRAGAERHDYHAAQQALGPAYLPVRPELASLRDHHLALPRERPIERALVFLSGANPSIELLVDLVHCVRCCGLQVAYLTADGLALPDCNGAEPLPPTFDMHRYFGATDLLVCGGGISKYEAAYCGIANACLSLTALQDADTRAMAALDLTLDLGPAQPWDQQRVRQRLQGFLADPAQRARQRTAFETRLVSDGTERLARRLLAR